MKITYYIYSEETKLLAVAADPATIGGHRITHPSREMYATIGAFPLADPMPAAPTPPNGKVAILDGYELGDSADGKVWTRKYRFDDAPMPAPRVFSKLKCVAALMEAGVWHEVKDYIESAGLYDLYLAAQNFREDNLYFTSGKAQLMTSLGWTEEQAEALLSRCIADGV